MSDFKELTQRILKRHYVDLDVGGNEICIECGAKWPCDEFELAIAVCAMTGDWPETKEGECDE